MAPHRAWAQGCRRHETKHGHHGTANGTQPSAGLSGERTGAGASDSATVASSESKMVSQQGSVGDRRDSGRRTLRTTAQVALNNAKSISVRTLDISPSGMSILATASPPVGTVFRIKFGLPKKPTGVLAIDVTARVVHTILDGREDGFKVGLQFIDPDEGVKAALQGFCK